MAVISICWQMLGRLDVLLGVRSRRLQAEDARGLFAYDQFRLNACWSQIKPWWNDRIAFIVLFIALFSISRLLCAIFSEFRASSGRRRQYGVLLALNTLLLSGCGLSSYDKKLGPVPLATVNLDRMAGGWYIVATIPNRLEHGIVAGYDVFTPQSSQQIHEDFYMQEGGFGNKRHHLSTQIAVLPKTGSASWLVHIFGPVNLPFQIIYVDPDYRYALFGEQNRKWGWIYSREQRIPEADYHSLLERFRALGFESGSFRKFVQIPDQIGQPGYWSDGIQ